MDKETIIGICHFCGADIIRGENYAVDGEILFCKNCQDKKNYTCLGCGEINDVGGYCDKCNKERADIKNIK